ncbi:transposase domain-containing protein [Streptosporangium sp. H16]|uniref:transposase domain-containing protein n=1 Tax=Streptosporangium sp. H16 TaxID=3444184 RepID=UPI003F793C09
MSSAIKTSNSPWPAAEGVFAPGHLGELTALVPFELVDAVLHETRKVQRRLRCLPSRVGVYFLLAMCLFPEIGHQLVWQKLTASLTALPVVMPTAKALRDLRRRVGSAPMRRLFEVLCGPLAQPSTPGWATPSPWNPAPPQRHATAHPNHAGDITGKAADSMNVNKPLTNRGWLRYIESAPRCIGKNARRNDKRLNNEPCPLSVGMLKSTDSSR